MTTHTDTKPSRRARKRLPAAHRDGHRLVEQLREACATAERLYARLQRHTCRKNAWGACGLCHLLDQVDDVIRATDFQANSVEVLLLPDPQRRQ